MIRRPRLRLRTRAALASGLIVLALSVGLSFFAYELTSDRLLDERADAAREQAFLKARVVRTALRIPDPDVTAAVSSVEGSLGSVSLVRFGGEWFTGSVSVTAEGLPASLVTTVSDGDAAEQRIRIEGEPFFVVGVPIAEADALYFELVSLDDIETALDRVARGLVVGGAVATIAGAALGWYTSGRVLRPVRRMAAAASQIAEGDLTARLDAQGDPDLESLVESFNGMADSVQERIDREARFAVDVSHELRSPLAAMHSAIQIARRRTDLAAAAEPLDHLQRRVEGFQELVTELLEISRAEAGVERLDLEVVDAADVVRSVLEARDAVDVAVVTSGDTTVLADRRRLAQMLSNLLENAERYAGGADRVLVGSDGDRVELSVDDRGPGVADHEKSYVFERFGRGDAARDRDADDGTGLGLALVVEHARLHGGSVRVEDRPGGGARFVIALPGIRGGGA